MTISLRGLSLQRLQPLSPQWYVQLPCRFHAAEEQQTNLRFCFRSRAGTIAAALMWLCLPGSGERRRYRSPALQEQRDGESQR